MIHNPYKIVRMFEEDIAEYTGAKYAISVDSCTNALFLCLKWWREELAILYKAFDKHSFEVLIPKRTYLSVPQSIMNAGFEVVFENLEWKGIYNLKNTPIWDAAKRLTGGMYIPGSLMCLSFHIKKHLPIGKGGMILTDNEESAKWFRKARYEGRSEVFYTEDNISSMGWNMYMTPEEAARGLMLLQEYSKYDNHEDLPENYRDLTEFDLFKNCKVIEKCSVPEKDPHYQEFTEFKKFILNIPFQEGGEFVKDETILSAIKITDCIYEFINDDFVETFQFDIKPTSEDDGTITIKINNVDSDHIITFNVRWDNFMRVEKFSDHESIDILLEINRKNVEDNLHSFFRKGA